MKYLALIVFFGSLCMACTHRAAQGEKPSATRDTVSARLRILCYNIHHANPPGKPDSIDLNAIARVITQTQPDLVALQEVDVYTTRSGKSLHQAEELGRITKMHVFFAKAIDYGGGEYGVAILSKHPIEFSENHPLPTAQGTGGEPRTLAKAIIAVTPARKIVFACTHFDAQRNDTNRTLQVAELLELLAKETLPVIVAGDLNADPSTRVIQVFDSRFTRTCKEGCPFTIPEINPNRTIDFIAFSPAHKFRVIEHKVLNETYASDHLPVFAILEFQ